MRRQFCKGSGCYYSFVLLLLISFHFIENNGAISTDYVFKYTHQIKVNFEKTFHERCDKYPFVDMFVNMTEDPTKDKHLLYMFSYGGLGDRLGGVLSAVLMALRFNRQLLVYSDSQVYKVFRPYHPTDIHAEHPKYRYTNFTSWTNYDSKNANNDATEYDLYDCNDVTGAKSSHCSMDSVKQVPQPIIKYRANRCYLCRYDLHEELIAHTQMSNRLGIHVDHDLYEVAGCLLRLALWPTERLWHEVDIMYDELYKEAVASKSAQRRSLLARERNTLSNRNRGDRQKISIKSVTANRIVNSNVATTTTTTTTTGKSNLDRKLEESFETIGSEAYEGQQSLDAGAASSLSSGMFQIGMHFRCGDQSYLQQGGYDHMCVWDEHRPKDFMEVGNPYGIARCAAHAFDQFQQGNDTAVEQVLEQQQGGVGSFQDKEAIAFVASDNQASMHQMESVAGFPTSLASPQGCHIQMDQSSRCLIFTSATWFALAMSDLMVTQTLGGSGAPTSSFSRYAGIYGLKENPFRNGRAGENCQPLSEDELRSMSRKTQSNWFC